MPFAATWMDLETIILSESQKEKHTRSLVCGTLKMIQMNLFTKQKQTYRLQKQTYSYQRDRLRGGMVRGLGFLYAPYCI